MSKNYEWVQVSTLFSMRNKLKMKKKSKLNVNYAEKVLHTWNVQNDDFMFSAILCAIYFIV